MQAAEAPMPAPEVVGDLRNAVSTVRSASTGDPDRDNSRATNSIRRAQNEALHRLGEALVVVGICRGVGLLFHFIGSIAHGNA